MFTFWYPTQHDYKVSEHLKIKFGTFYDTTIPTEKQMLVFQLNVGPVLRITGHVYGGLGGERRLIAPQKRFYSSKESNYIQVLNHGAL